MQNWNNNFCQINRGYDFYAIVRLYSVDSESVRAYETSPPSPVRLPQVKHGVR